MVDLLRRQSEAEVRAAFRGLGAVTPANARPVKEFPAFDATTFAALLRRGVIREGAPGTFYLYVPPPVPRHLARQALFWIALIAIPLGIVGFCRAVN